MNFSVKIAITVALMFWLSGFSKAPLLLWSDSKASSTATFQSHVDKLLVMDGTIYLAYTYRRVDGVTANKVLALDLETKKKIMHMNNTASNSGCLIEINGEIIHIYEDFQKKELHVDSLSNSKQHKFLGVKTAGKITCKKTEESIYIGLSYGAVYQLKFDHSLIPTLEKIRADFSIMKPEFGQYPHFTANNGVLYVFNNTIYSGWYYYDLILSRCSKGECTEQERLFPLDLQVSNTWVGDVLVRKDGSILIYFSKNDYHFDSISLLKKPKANIGYLGVYKDAEWRIHKLGARTLSGQLIERDGKQYLISMTQGGQVSSHIVEKNGIKKLKSWKIPTDCAYALNAIILEDSLILALTDRGPGCFNETGSGETMIWQLSGL